MSSLSYMKSLRKIYALIPEEEFLILRDSGILSKEFDLWLAVTIAEKLQKDGLMDDKGNPTKKIKKENAQDS